MAAYEPLAQMVEHSTFNRGVVGSNPIWFTLNKDLISNYIGPITRKIFWEIYCILFMPGFFILLYKFLTGKYDNVSNNSSDVLSKVD
jgi:hypothetical protein